MAAYAYMRVSTETQAEKGGGLEMQRQNIDRYAYDNDIHIDGYYTDAGISGALADTDDDDAISKRAGLVELLGAIEDNDTIIVMNTSRLWRSDNAKVLIRRELLRHHVRVIALDNPKYDINAKNPNDRLIDGLMELLDEWERLSINLKLARGRTAKAKTGAKPAGLCPYGYRYSEDKKSVILEPREAQAIKRAFTEGQKGTSLVKIAKILQAEGYATRRGGVWNSASVGVILHNRFYIGELQHQGVAIQGTHEPIISAVQFGKVQKQLERHHK